mmetsp:Transcript_74022/g.160115  ORF Transcript_74022/g.160115 Transcript_74022/m.160115 type:complete len:261 (-) Transcript_74022:194-976(-)
MPHQVAQATRHVQPRIARILCVNPVVGIAIEDDSPTSFLNPRPLIFQVWLVISSKLESFQTRFCRLLPSSENRSAVGDVGNCKRVFVVVMYSNGAGSARQLGVQLLHLVHGGNQTLNLPEGINADTLELVVSRLEPRVLHYQLHEVVFDKIGDIMSLLSMSVEHAVDGKITLHLQHHPRILVWTLRLQAFPACIAQAGRRLVHLFADLCHGLVSEGRLALVGAGSNAEFSAASSSISLDHLEDVLLVEPSDQPAVIFSDI